MYDLMLLAQDVAEAPKSSWWMEAVATVVGLLITAFLIPFLKQKAAAAKAEADKYATDAAATDIDAHGALVARLKAFLWGNAAAIAEKRFPEIAEKIKNKKLQTKEQIKEELRSWGAQLRSDAIAYFGHQGIDIVKAVGDEWLDKLIERAANHVSPFPGRDTAVTLLQDQVTDWIINNGVDWVKARYLSLPVDDNGGSPD